MTPSPHHFDQTISRLADVLAHTKRYSFKAPSRLSQDAGVHPASVFRILQGGGNPSFLTVTRITEAIERELGLYSLTWLGWGSESLGTSGGGDSPFDNLVTRSRVEEIEPYWAHSFDDHEAGFG